MSTEAEGRVLSPLLCRCGHDEPDHDPYNGCNVCDCAQWSKRDYDGMVREHLAAEAKRVRPFCDTWPWSSSDLDLVLPEHNDAVHKARGCCDGWLP